jgi:hypothetical protein
MFFEDVPLSLRADIRTFLRNNHNASELITLLRDIRLSNKMKIKSSKEFINKIFTEGHYNNQHVVGIDIKCLFLEYCRARNLSLLLIHYNTMWNSFEDVPGQVERVTIYLQEYPGWSFFKIM